MFSQSNPLVAFWEEKKEEEVVEVWLVGRTLDFYSTSVLWA